METKILTREAIELSTENIQKIAPVTEDWTVQDICDLLGRNKEDWSDITINEKTPIARQGDCLILRNSSRHFVDPKKFDLELKISNTDILTQSTLNGNTHRLVSANSAFKIYESKGINQHEAYSKMGLPVSDWMKSTTVGNMYIELGEGTFLAHQEHGQRVLCRGFYEVRQQNSVDISGYIRKQID